MVLVDTSVWIRFLGNRAPYAAEMDRLLGLEEVTGHELVYGELLIGDRGGRRKLLAAYERMHQTPLVSHGDVVAFVRDRDLHGHRIRHHQDLRERQARRGVQDLGAGPAPG